MPVATHRNAELAPPDVQALHAADRWTRIAAWCLLVATLLPMPVSSFTGVKWYWIWERLAHLSVPQCTALLAWVATAIFALVAARRKDKGRTVLLVFVPTLAYAVYMATAGFAWGLVGRNLSAFTVMHGRPIAMFLLILIAAASRLRLRSPRNATLRRVVGVAGLIASILLLAPLPDSWVRAALTGEAWSARSFGASVLILAETAIAVTAAAALLGRRTPPGQLALLGRMPIWVLVAILAAGFLGIWDFLPGRRPLWIRLWNVTRWHAFLYGSFILLAAGWYRALLLWTRSNADVRELEATFS